MPKSDAGKLDRTLKRGIGEGIRKAIAGEPVGPSPWHNTVAQVPGTAAAAKAALDRQGDVLLLKRVLGQTLAFIEAEARDECYVTCDCQENAIAILNEVASMLGASDARGE